MKIKLHPASNKEPEFKAGDIVQQKDLIGIVFKEYGALKVAWTNGVTTQHSQDLNTHFYGIITITRD